MSRGNPYHGIFVLDEQICGAETEQELYEIRAKIKKNRKYSLDTKLYLYSIIYNRFKELEYERLPYAVRMRKDVYQWMRENEYI